MPTAHSNACHSACDKARGAILLVIVVYCLVNMWRAKNLGVVYQNFRKILVSKKKNFTQSDAKILKNPFYANFFIINCIFLCQI